MAEDLIFWLGLLDIHLTDTEEKTVESLLIFSVEETMVKNTEQGQNSRIREILELLGNKRSVNTVRVDVNRVCQKLKDKLETVLSPIRLTPKKGIKPTGFIIISRHIYWHLKANYYSGSLRNLDTNWEKIKRSKLAELLENFEKSSETEEEL